MAKLNDRTERLEARVSPEFKSQLALAAHLEGLSMTDFILQHLTRATRQVLDDHSRWKLTRADSEALVEALLDPQPPDPRLVRAVRKRR